MAQRGGFRQRIGEIQIDRTTLAIFAAGATLFAALLFPKLYPAAQRGPSCSDLASPIGGNNRSMLAQVDDAQPNLDLNLDLDSTTIRQNEPLRVRVTFVNGNIGPVILYLTGQRPPLSNDANAVGIRFELARLDGTLLLPNEATTDVLPGTPPTWVDPGDLHLLGSRDRCSQQYEYSLDPGVLVPGDYRIRAFYRNENVGGQRPVGQFDPTPTATPAYFNQGIWTGAISSQEVRFTVQPPTAPTS
ncbi:MAG TPA: hypothetical protein VMT24_06910 [Aggregatilineaceae bacterium]|nr:hypothetical protein [Aggregatilineaceae bacterium]